ncbi:MAG: lactate racemase domain-containing protein, partial [Armatimonadetes bacterium]|nr:lactate racemase domain-containing protein [Armatimonadota bacterium]
MRVRLDYGKVGLEVEFPDHNTKAVLGLKPAVPLENPNKAIAHALRQPIATPSLADIARGRRDACIVLCDITRPVPNKLLLPPILETLHRSGIPKERVTILIATGTHRPNWGDELEALVGGDIAGSYRVVNHDSKSLSTHRFMGTSPNGVP